MRYEHSGWEEGIQSQLYHEGGGAGNMNAIRPSSSGEWAVETLTTGLNVHYRFPLPISPLSVQPITLL